MEEKKNKQPLKAGLRVAIAFYIGYNLIYPIGLIGMLTSPREFWGFMIAYLFLTIVNGQLVFGLLVSCLIGWAAYLVFRFLIKKELSRKQFNWIMFPSMLLIDAAGFLVMNSTRKFFDELIRGKEKVWEIDTNGDGKIDKWVHDDVYDKLTELDYDINLDGNPDIWEYYRGDRQLYKKIIDSNFDGKPDKTELINDEKK